MSASDRRSAGLLAFLACVFFASSFAALLYQVIWQRLLALFSGADVFSVTIIVAAFMGGLSVGNLTGGRLADRVSRASCLLLCAAAELAIAAFALGSRLLYYDLLYRGLGGWALGPAAMGAVLFLSLLWPTFFMGLSLPLLARGLSSGVEDAPRVIGSLYGWNTLGAALGALATPWILLRHVGFDTCLLLGASLNAACAVAVLIARRARAPEEIAGGPKPAVDLAPSTAPIFGIRTWLTVYALSGAIALSLEIAWFRVLGVIGKSTSFTFGTLLGVYLLGIAIGSIAGARNTVRSSADPAPRFLLIQAGVTVWALVSLAALLAWAGANLGESHGVVACLRSLEPLRVGDALAALAADPLGSLAKQGLGEHSPGLLLVLYAGIPLLLIGPSTFLMGLSFPWLQRALQTDTRWLGRRVGWLQTANIGGSLAGSLSTGFALLPLLGTGGTFRGLAVAAIAFPLLLQATRIDSARRALQIATFSVLALAGALLPSGSAFWAPLHGVPPREIRVVEDASGVSALVGFGAETLVVAGGAEISTIPFGGYDGIHTLLGAVPALLHPSPKRIAVIGRGPGDSRPPATDLNSDLFARDEFLIPRAAP